MGNTGYKSFASLELYYTDDDSYAGVTKPNLNSDPDYIAPILDTATCTPSARFYNTIRTLTVKKNDCFNGEAGSEVTLTANVNQFLSDISVDDANVQADSWLAINAQTYANNLGTCTLDNIVPTAPTGLAVSAITATTLTLNWNASTDNVEVTNYTVYKGGVLLISLGNVLTYNVSSLVAGTDYVFTVYANDAAGNISAVSNTANATTASSSGGSGGTGTVNTGNIYNNTGHTISATTMKVIANGAEVVSVAIPSLITGGLYSFNTTYTSQIFSNGTFDIEFIKPVVGINTGNMVYMTGGTQSTVVYLSDMGSSFKATTISSGPQYAINITII